MTMKNVYKRTPWRRETIFSKIAPCDLLIMFDVHHSASNIAHLLVQLRKNGSEQDVDWTPSTSEVEYAGLRQFSHNLRSLVTTIDISYSSPLDKLPPIMWMNVFCTFLFYIWYPPTIIISTIVFIISYFINLITMGKHIMGMQNGLYHCRCDRLKTPHISYSPSWFGLHWPLMMNAPSCIISML